MPVQISTSMMARRTCASPPSCRSTLGSLTGRPLRRRKLQTCSLSRIVLEHCKTLVLIWNCSAYCVPVYTFAM